MSLLKQIVRDGIVSQADADDAESRWKKLSPIARPPLVQYLVEIKKLPQRTAERIEQTEQRRQDLLGDRVLKQTLEDIRDGKAILFVGAGFSLQERMDLGTRSIKGLTGRRIKQVLDRDIEGKQPDLKDAGLSLYNLGQTALIWENVMSQDRVALKQLLSKMCREFLPENPLRQHALLARIQEIRFIVTTNWDRLLERAYAAAGYDGRSSINVICKDDDVGSLDFSRPTLIKMHGDIDEKGNWAVDPSITDDDFIKREPTIPAIFSLLRTLFLTHRVVVVGFDPRDYSLNRLVRFALHTAPQTRHRLVVVNPDPFATLAVPLDKPHHIQASGERFLDIVKDYIENDGDRSGFARRVTTHVGPASVWARDNCDLAGRLLNKWKHLQRVDVVKPAESGKVRGLDPGGESVARRAAVLLRELVKPGSQLTLSCGTTLRRMIDHLDATTCPFKDVHVYASTVPLSDDSDVTSPSGLVSMFANRFEHMKVRGHAYQLPASFSDAFVAKKMLELFPDAPDNDAWKLIRAAASSGPSDDALAGARKYVVDAGRAAVMCFGIGAIDQDGTSLMRYALACLRACHLWKASKEDEVAKVKRYSRLLVDRLGISGDLMYKLFRSQGEGSLVADDTWTFLDSHRAVECLKAHDPLPPDRAVFAEFVIRLCSQVLAVDPAHVHSASQETSQQAVVLVGHGHLKAKAMRAILDAGYGNHAVVDMDLAEAIAN